MTTFTSRALNSFARKPQAVRDLPVVRMHDVDRIDRSRIYSLELVAPGVVDMPVHAMNEVNEAISVLLEREPGLPDHLVFVISGLYSHPIAIGVIREGYGYARYAGQFVRGEVPYLAEDAQPL
jgi:hypothetical protein